jgi:hypothetical protein
MMNAGIFKGLNPLKARVNALLKRLALCTTLSSRSAGWDKPLEEAVENGVEMLPWQSKG